MRADVDAGMYVCNYTRKKIDYCTLRTNLLKLHLWLLHEKFVKTLMWFTEEFSRVISGFLKLFKCFKDFDGFFL
jgi:hypothetical protein